MTLEAEFKEVMEADSDLMELLTGGVYEAIQVGEISRQLTPGAFDGNMKIKPCALIKQGTEIPRGPYRTSVQTSVQIFLYEHPKLLSISVAMDILFDLFNQLKMGDGVWTVEYESSTWNERSGTDITVDWNSCAIRFVAVRLRSTTEIPS